MHKQDTCQLLQECSSGIKMAVDAINMRDYPVIQAYVVWMAVIYVGINLITDISYRVLDPRIRLGGDKA